MRKCLAQLGCEYSDAVLEGFKFTPQYKGNTGIFTDKVSEGVDADLSHPLLQSRTDLRQKYSDLLQIAY